MSRYLVLGPLIVACLGTAVVVSLTIGDMLHRFEENLGRVLRDRLAIVLQTIESRLEEEITLGLSLATLTGVRERLDGWVAENPEVRLIEVFGTDGTVLFSTDGSFVGDLVPETWLKAWKEGADGRWSLDLVDTHTIGTTLTTGDGAIIGGLGLTFGVDPQRALKAETRNDLIGGGIAVLGTAVLILAVSLVLVMRPAQRRLDILAAKARRLPEEPETAKRGGGWFDRSFAAAAAAAGDIAQAREKIRELDGEA